LEVSQTLQSIPLPLSSDEPIDTGEEGPLEESGESIQGVDDDGPFGLQGDDFDQELAARIMLQDEFGSGEGHIGSSLGEAADE